MNFVESLLFERPLNIILKTRVLLHCKLLGFRRSEQRFAVPCIAKDTSNCATQTYYMLHRLPNSSILYYSQLYNSLHRDLLQTRHHLLLAETSNLNFQDFFHHKITYNLINYTNLVSSIEIKHTVSSVYTHQVVTTSTSKRTSETSTGVIFSFPFVLS
jgi:hypothetical protein